MENGFYAQVFMIRQRDLYDKREKYKTKIQLPRTISKKKNWFDLDHEWLKENFMTREPYFY